MSHPDAACPDCDGCGARCDACGEPWPDGAALCPECNHRVVRKCETCRGRGVLDDDADEEG